MRKGSKMSLESRIKMSTNYKYHSPWKGKKFSEEHKQKLRLAKLGKHLSLEHKKHISKTQIRIGNKPPSSLGRKL